MTSQAYAHASMVLGAQGSPDAVRQEDLQNYATAASVQVSTNRLSAAENAIAALAARVASLEQRVAAPVPSAPAWSSGGGLTGSHLVGDPHTLTFGTWTGTPIEFDSQLLLSGVETGDPVITPAATLTITYIPVAAHGGKLPAMQVRGRNSAGWGPWKVFELGVAITAVVASSWVRGTPTADIVSRIVALSGKDDGSESWWAQTVITGGGGSGVTAPAPLGTALSNVTTNNAPTLTVPTAARASNGATNALVFGVFSGDYNAVDGSVFGWPDGGTDWMIKSSFRLSGEDGMSAFLACKYYPAGAPDTIAASNTFNKTFNSVAFALSSAGNPGSPVDQAKTIEWVKAVYSDVGSAGSPTGTLNIEITPDLGTSYPNTMLVFVGAPDSIWSSVITAFTPPNDGVAWTELIDSAGSGAARPQPITVAYQVKASPWTAAKITGKATIDTGTAPAKACPAGWLIAVRGASSGGGTELSAAGVIQRVAFDGTNWGSVTAVKTLTSADSWITGLSVSANGSVTAWSAASPQWLGPGYTVVRTKSPDGSKWLPSQRYVGTFDPLTTAEGESAAPNGAVALDASGNVMRSVFAGPTLAMYAYRGASAGQMFPQPSSTAPATKTLAAPALGNSVAIANESSATLVTAVISGGKVVFQRSTDGGVTWQDIGELTSTLLSGTPLHATMSRSGQHLAVQTSAGQVDTFIGSVSAGWSSRGSLTAQGGYTDLGDCLFFKADGSKLFLTERSTTNATGSLATVGGIQKRMRVVPYSIA